MVEQQPDRLQPVRDAVRRAGRQTRRVRTGLVVLLAFLMALLPTLEPSIRFALEVRGWLAIGGQVAALIAAGIAFLGAWLYRDFQAGLLVERVRDLPPGQRDAVLREMLVDPHKDVRALANALARGVPAGGREAVPASAPDGTGSETVPAPEVR